MNPYDTTTMSTKKIKRMWNRSKKHGTIHQQQYWQALYENRVGYRRW